MAAAINQVKSPSVTSHTVIRLVQPGSWQHCVHCLETIQFVPSGRRAQATCKEYSDGVWQSVEHYHLECFVECFHGYGTPA